MTNSEAIKTLDSMLIGNESVEVFNAIQMAISALEKQIPRKPLDTQKEGFYSAEFDFSCPNCNVWITGVDKDNFVWGNKQDYCECCGQAIDWSETE